MKDWLHVDYQESDSSWTAKIKDDNGIVMATFRYNSVKPKKLKKTSGVTRGVYKKADEDYKGTGVVSPKSPAKLNAEDEAEWYKKTLIEQATKPYEFPGGVEDVSNT